MYLAVKHTHLTLVILSITLFYIRYFHYKLRSRPQPKLMKIAPHVIDTLLLVSAIALCFIIEQYPIAVSWLTIKVLAVVGYIGFAIAAMKTDTKNKSLAFLAGATICVLMAGKIAVTKPIF